MNTIASVNRPFLKQNEGFKSRQLLALLMGR